MWCIKGILALSVVHSVYPANILGIFPHPGKSHYVMFEPLMIALAEKGHDVDVYTHFPSKPNVPGFNEISLKGSMPIFSNNITVSFIEETSSITANIYGTLRMCGTTVCKKVLESPALKDLKNSKKKYDLVITEVFATDCMLGFGHHFKTPIVSVTTSVNVPWASDRIGNPDNPSYIPVYFLHASGKMGLYERMVNTILLLQSKYIYGQFVKEHTQFAREFFGMDMPPLDEIALNTSLLLVNSHLSMNMARPSVPNFIEVGGLHIKEPKKLPEDFERLISSKPKGAIFFSMGSLMRVETFPLPKLKGIFDAFAELSEYTIIWKGDKESFPKDISIPSNVHFKNWVPQIELLCHPNVKMFVTHGGQMGSQEAAYCGIPRLGIPLFSDQESNVRQSAERGAAVRVGYHEISKETMLDASLKLLDDPNYRINAQRLSKLFRDRPMSPLDTATYWIEYVIRHNGAPHLRINGADLPWYQYYLIDIGMIIFFGIVLVIYLGVVVTKIILKLTFGRCLCTSKSKRD